MRWRYVPIALTLAAAACASLDGLSGGEVSPPDTTEAGAPSQVSDDGGAFSAEDARADADVDDAEASARGDAGLSFCASRTNALFCADFDESPDAGAGWTSASATIQGGVNVGSPALSAPSGARFAAALVSGPVNPPGGIFLSRFLSVTNATFRGLALDFDVYNTSLGEPVIAYDVLQFGFSRPGVNDVFELTGNRDSFNLTETRPQVDGGGTPATIFVASTPIPLDAWTHITVTLTLNTTQTASTVTLQTSTTAAQSKPAAIEMFLDMPLNPYFSIGVFNTTGPRAASIDNVVVHAL